MEISMIDNHLSFLHARDPSIIAARRPINPDVCMNLETILKENSSSNSNEEVDNYLQVHLRIKPAKEDFSNIYTINNKVLTCVVPEESQVLRNAKEGDILIKKFTFSKIFGPDSKQAELFDKVVKEKVLSCINGKNSTIMTYGASGSGKTFTIVGTASEPGIIPRALEYLFRSIPKLSEIPSIKLQPLGNVTWIDNSLANVEVETKQYLLNSTLNTTDRNQHVRTYRTMQQRLSHDPVAEIVSNKDVVISIWISFAEIYQDYIYDLLDLEQCKDKPRLKLRLGQTKNGVTYIKNLKQINVCNGLEAYQILQYGLHNLKYASTRVNSHSSRSHCIFTVKLVQIVRGENAGRISCFTFCDLAGSERLKKTLNVGDRLKESNCINNSLLVLGRCIKLIRESQRSRDRKQIPFRESKLTQLFQKALSGKEDIAMIVNMNPDRAVFDESHHVLNFSAIAKDVILEAPPAKAAPPPRVTRFTKYLEKNGYRSTEIAATNAYEEDYKEEVDKLVETIQQLYCEIERLKKELVNVEKVTRFEVVNEVHKLRVADREKHAEELNELKEKHEEELEENFAEIKALKFKLAESEPVAKKQKVIVLDDSDDEEHDSSRKQNEILRKKIEQHIEYKRELQDKVILLELSNVELNTKLEKERQQTAELELTLKSAAVDYNTLNKQFMEYKKENVELRRKLQLLEENEADVSAYADNIGASDYQENINGYETMQSECTTCSYSLSSKSRAVEETDENISTLDYLDSNEKENSNCACNTESQGHINETNVNKSITY